VRLPNWLKIIWWLILVIISVIFIAQRFDSIMNGTSGVLDIIVLLVLIALLTIPLFQEVNFFGVGLKREIDNLKTEFKEQIFNLRSDIQNTINMRTEISPQIYLTPPTDSELPSIEERIRPILEQVLREQGIEKPVSIPEELTVSSDAKFLFSVRYTMERELRRIWKQWRDRIIEMRLWTGQSIADLERLPLSVFQITRSLTESEIISPQLSSVIREVYRACSSAIHGEEVSQTAVGFVRGVAPSLITSLQATNITWLGTVHKTEDQKT